MLPTGSDGVLRSSRVFRPVSPRRSASFPKPPPRLAKDPQSQSCSADRILLLPTAERCVFRPIFSGSPGRHRSSTTSKSCDRYASCLYSCSLSLPLPRGVLGSARRWAGIERRQPHRRPRSKGGSATSTRIRRPTPQCARRSLQASSQKGCKGSRCERALAVPFPARPSRHRLPSAETPSGSSRRSRMERRRPSTEAGVTAPVRFPGSGTLACGFGTARSSGLTISGTSAVESLSLHASRAGRRAATVCTNSTNGPRQAHQRSPEGHPHRSWR